MDYKSQTTQKIVEMMYKTFKLYTETNEVKKEITPKLFAKLSSISFREGEIGTYFKKQYGEKACQKISDAIAYFAGFDDYNSMIRYLEEEIK